MQDYEKLGAFYLGREYDLGAKQLRPELLLYDSKDLTTHAVCVGMTGSGKTGLCLSLLEEAAIDGIPAIAIDPKGDLGNLLLTFPKLRPEDFQNWIDPGEAARHGMSVADYARQTADRWRKGLAEWDQTPERIAKFRESADVAIYTPASNAGIPLTVLRSFQAPSPDLIADSDAFRDRILAAVSGLLALVGIEADPIRSPEHILVSTIFETAWRAGRNLDMPTLIREIQNPPFDKVGFLDLEAFLPAKDRFDLSIRINNLLASPSFSSWMEGESLDVARLLHTPEGRPRLSIISIAHLSESERMFFVTILLNEIVSWMRTQPGTSSLRALLYMDEVFGYFPPTANPPSKTPMLTLMKQARAYGLGVVLATQNPVDLDYKGLSNAGTWFLGRLQTERDKQRVLDGLEGASASAGSAFDRREMESILAALGNRVFLMHNVHDDAPVIFQTRWVLSYLRGPLTRDQIRQLMADRVSESSQKRAATPKLAAVSPAAAGAATSAYPVVPPDVEELFLTPASSLANGSRLVYRPMLLGTARLHFTDRSTKTDEWADRALLFPAGDRDDDPAWDEADHLHPDKFDTSATPRDGAEFAELPAQLTNVRNYSSWRRQLKDFLYRNEQLPLYRCKELKACSTPDETEGDFRVRITQLAREHRDLKVEKLRNKYAPRVERMQERIRKAEQKVEKEEDQASSQTLSSVISFGTTILGAVFGRKLASRTNASRVGTSARSASRVMKERADVKRAAEDVEAYKKELEEMEKTFEEEIEQLKESLQPQNLEIETVEIRPRKSDLMVEKLALTWTPWQVDGVGIAEPMFELKQP